MRGGKWERLGPWARWGWRPFSEFLRPFPAWLGPGLFAAPTPFRQLGVERSGRSKSGINCSPTKVGWNLLCNRGKRHGGERGLFRRIGERFQGPERLFSFGIKQALTCPGQHAEKSDPTVDINPLGRDKLARSPL